jgi:EmrB/QacA subfamily drug resistance transporter
VTETRTNPWAVLTVLCFGFFMVLLDVTIVNIAIPSMVDGLQATLDQILWVLNAYTLTYAVLLITAGRLGDRFGPRNLFAIGLALFTLASAACGFAQDPVQLIIARVFQGIGGSLLTPQTLAIITTIFPPERRGAAFGIWGAIAGLATIAGPTLGGVIVTYLDWRWIFFVNVPIGLGTLVAAFLVVPDLRPGRAAGVEPIGVLLASAGLLAVTFGLIEGQRFSWGTVTTVAGVPITITEFLVAGGVLIAAFFVWDHFRTQPLVPMALFRDRNFGLMNWVSAAVSFAMVGLFLPLTIYLQSALGFTALEAALTMLPMSLVMLPTAPFAGRLADRFGGKYILMGGLTMFAAGMGWVDWRAGIDSTWLTFLPGLLVAGVGIGCTFAPLTTVAMRNVQPRLAGAASGVLNTMRQLGGAFASAIVGAVLQNRLAASLHDRAVEYANQLPPQLPPAARQRFIDGFSHAASGGLEIGRSSGAAMGELAGLPPQVTAEITRIAHEVFAYAFIDAMKPTLVVPIAVLAVGAVSCFGIKRRQRAPAVEPAEAPRTAA